MKNVCPKCGSIKVDLHKKYGECLESDCLHVGPISPFRTGGSGQIHNANKHWRDPVAMSMDGYGGE